MNLDHSQNPLILLTHIPKCAGSSFRESVIDPNIDAESIYRPLGGLREIPKHVDDFRYLVGHWPNGIEKLFSKKNPVRKRPIIKIVILREPVDQMISYYYHHKELAEWSPIREKVRRYELVEFYENNWRFRNLQTQFVAGFLYHCDRSPLKWALRPFPNIMAIRALRALENDYQFVIRQDNTEASFVQCAHQLGFKYEPKICGETVTKGRPKRCELEKADVLRLAELSSCDVKLYDHAKELGIN